MHNAGCAFITAVWLMQKRQLLTTRMNNFFKEIHMKQPVSIGLSAILGLLLSFPVLATNESEIGVEEFSLYDSVPGGWTDFSTQIDASARQVFDEALGRIVGVGYSPIAVASQVSQGVNYRFFCNAYPVTTPGMQTYPVMVKIYKPIYGQAQLMSIRDIHE